MRQLLYPYLSCQPLFVAGRKRRSHSMVWMNGVGGLVRQADFSPDGHYMAGCSDDTTSAVWNTKTGLLEMRLQDHMTLSTPSHFHRVGNTLPLDPAIGLCAYGICSPVRRWANHCLAIQTLLTRFVILLTGSILRRGRRTGRYGCGTRVLERR